MRCCAPFASGLNWLVLFGVCSVLFLSVLFLSVLFPITCVVFFPYGGSGAVLEGAAALII